jgi:hypothetical protein
MTKFLSTPIVALAAFGLLGAASAKADSIFDLPEAVVGGAVNAGADIVGVAQPYPDSHDRYEYAVPATPMAWEQCGLGIGCRTYIEPLPAYGYAASAPYDENDCHVGRVVVAGHWRRAIICE